MGKTYLFNDTNAPKIMGGKLVPPGEGREVDDVAVLPGEGPAAAPEALAPQADTGANLAAVLKQPLRLITPELAGFSDETLEQLLQLEQLSDTPRQTLLSAIGELQLSRARAKTGGDAA